MDEVSNTVFIIDDNVKNLQVVANLLRMSNYRVLFADNGKDGLKNIEKYRPDIILLDIMMPNMDGFEVCHRLKNNEKTRDIPVIFLTAKTESDSLTKAFELGGVDYVVKPFKSNELLARINAHVTIRKQKKQLEEVSITKDKLFSVLGHDLRGNLTSILSISELLLDESYVKDNEQIKEFHRYINNQANNLNIILNNVIDWSKSRDNTLAYDPRKVDLKKAAKSNVKLLKENASLKNIKLTSEITEPIIAYADENMLNTVLRNLIFNAIKFTNNGGNISIDVTVSESEAIMKVIDTGVGIRKEKQDSIFNSQNVVSTKGTAKETGTGLGLMICKEFTEKNKGRIWLESQPGKGTTVFFSIPLFIVLMKVLLRFN